MICVSRNLQAVKRSRPHALVTAWREERHRRVSRALKRMKWRRPRLNEIEHLVAVDIDGMFSAKGGGRLHCRALGIKPAIERLSVEINC
jgi:hypothetical protein